jgi:hypothetical protein
MVDLTKIKKDIEALYRKIQCLFSITPSATQWTSNHSSLTGNKYKKGTLVWHQGFIYKCLEDNNGSDINNPYFWDKVSPGWLLQQEQADWNATEGPSFIRNKPFNLGGQETDPLFQAWLATNPLASFLTEETDPLFNNWLATNPLSGFITSENDPIFQAWLATNPLASFITSEVDPIFQSWLSSSPLSGFVPYTGATQNVDLGNFDLKAKSLKVVSSASTSGIIDWNTEDGTFNMHLLNNTKLQAGQELHFYGKAQDDILNGESVQFVGTQGDHFIFKRAVASEISANPKLFMGIATHNINTNEFGYVTSFGKVRDLNTTMWEEGDILYFDSDGISGETLVPVLPPAGNAHIIVAVVLRKHVTQGVIFVRPHVMPKLNQIQDVSISGVTNGQVLTYNEGLWKNDLKTIYQPYISPSIITTPTVISSLRIPANWLKDGDTIKIEYIIRKDTATTNNVNYSLFQGNSINSITNTITSNINLTPAQRTNNILRYLTLNGTDLICNVRVNNTAGIQTVPDSAPLVITGFDRTVDNWISLQITPVAPDAPAAYINYMLIEKYT